MQNCCSPGGQNNIPVPGMFFFLILYGSGFLYIPGEYKNQKIPSSIYHTLMHQKKLFVIFFYSALHPNIVLL